MTTPGIPISVGDFLARVAVTGETLDTDPSYGGYDSWYRVDKRRDRDRLWVTRLNPLVRRVSRFVLTVITRLMRSRFIAKSKRGIRYTSPNVISRSSESELVFLGARANPRSSKRHYYPRCRQVPMSE